MIMIPDACSRIIKHTLPIETAKRDGDEENASKGRLEVMKTIPCSFSFSLSSLSFVHLQSLLWFLSFCFCTLFIVSKASMGLTLEK